MTVRSIRDWLRTEARLGTGRLREPGRLPAILLLGVSGGLIVTFLLTRGELAGSDAQAYWAGIRVWLAGGDAYHPPEPFLPYVYAPWTLGLFVPWALLPWSVAWFLWRWVNILMLIWTAHWAYQRRPLATAIAITVLAAPIAATLDTGNVTFILALMVWATRFVGSRTGGFLWALATSIKWFPVLFLVILPARMRLWGVAWLGLAGMLLLATWPETLVHLQVGVNFPRPIRVDLLLLAWGAVPWLWTDERLWRLDAVRRFSANLRLGIARSWRDLRDADGPATAARRQVGAVVRSFFGVG